jgi:hypothetical protein
MPLRDLSLVEQENVRSLIRVLRARLGNWTSVERVVPISHSVRVEAACAAVIHLHQIVTVSDITRSPDLAITSSTRFAHRLHLSRLTASREQQR